MDKTTSGTWKEISDIPVAATIKVERNTGYGSVPGLDDEELLNEQELERWVEWQTWGPVLALPCQRPKWSIRPTIDEQGRPDWGAFGTVDFERVSGGFDKARYKADKLRAELRMVLIRLECIRERLPARAAYLTLKHVREGVLSEEHLTSDAVRVFVRLQRRAQQLREEIGSLRAASSRREEAALQRALARLPG